MLIRICVRSICRGLTSHLNSGSTLIEHQNRHATSVIVLSYKQSRYLNAHVHKLQHSARSRLFNDLFLRHESPRTSFDLFAWSHGRRRRVWSLSLNSTTLLDSDWAVAAWCGHSAPVCCIQQASSVQSKPWGLWTFLIATLDLSIRAGTKTWKRIVDRLSNEVLSRSLSCTSDES